MSRYEFINFGLQELPPDERDFSLGGFDRLPALKDLPLELRLPFIVKDQGETDWCSAFATCAASEVQEGVELEPGYSFAAGKELSGDVDAWGQNLRTACAAHQKYGALAIEDLDEDISERQARHFDNWRRYLPEALQHRKQSYFKITGPYDHFDNIRAALHKYQTPAVVGITFGYDLGDPLLATTKPGFGHAMTVIGYTQRFEHLSGPTLIVGNSYGEEAGLNGVHYVTRSVINENVEKYGAFMFVDAAREDYEYNQQWGIKASDNWLMQFVKIGYTVLKSWYNSIVRTTRT